MSRYICPTVDTTPSDVVDMPREVNPRPALPRRSSSTRRLLWGMLSSKSSLNDEERGERGREGVREEVREDFELVSRVGRRPQPYQ